MNTALHSTHSTSSILIACGLLLGACNLGYEDRALESPASDTATSDEDTDAAADTAVSDSRVDVDSGDTDAGDTTVIDTTVTDTTIADTTVTDTADTRADTASDDTPDSADVSPGVCPDTVLGLRYGRTLTVAASAGGLEAGDSVSFDLDVLELWDTGRLRVDLVDLRVVHCREGALEVLDVVVDPASATDATMRTLWFALQDDIAADTADASYRLLYGNASVDTPSPADARAVFELAGLWRAGAPDALAPDFVAQTAGGGQVSIAADEGLRIQAPSTATDAAHVVTASALRGDREFSVRHEFEFLSSSTSLQLDSALYALAVVGGEAPNPVNQATTDNSIMVALTTYGGLLVYRDATNALHAWGGSAWGSTPFNAARYELSEGPRLFELDSDGDAWRLTVREVDGTVVTVTDPVSWSETHRGTMPLWLHWGDPYAADHAMDGRGGYTWVRHGVDDRVLVALGPEEDITP